MKNTAKSILTIALVIVMLPIVACTFCPCAHASPSNQVVLKAQPCHHGCCPDMNLSPGQTCRADIQKPSDLIYSGDYLMFFQVSQAAVSSQLFPTNESGNFDVDSSPHYLTQDSPLYLLLSVFRI